MPARSNDVAPYFDADYELIPLRPNDKPPRDVNWRARPYSRADIESAIESGYNVGVRLRATDLVCDWDPRNGGETEEARAAAFSALWERIGADPDDFPQVKTGGGGAHFYMKLPPDCRTRAHLGDLPGWDFKSQGGFVVSAGSQHPNGRHYEWVAESGDDLGLLGAPGAPDALIDALRRPVLTAAEIRAGLEGMGDFSVEELALCLDELDVEGFANDQSWRDLGMACWYATAGAGKDVFLEWSAGDSFYAGLEERNAVRWDSFAPTPGQDMITTGTLAFYLKEAGVNMNQLLDRMPEFADEYPDDLPALPEAAAAEAEVAPADRANDALEDLNERFCVVAEGDKVRVFKRTWDSEGWARLTERDFKTMHSYRTLARNGPNGIVQVPLGKAWLEWHGRRNYAAARFAPEGVPENVLNLWTGWGTEPAAPGEGSWDMFRDLIREDLVDGREDAFEYAMNWMAWFVQRPHIIPEVALVFRGPPGTGKGTFGRALKRLAGLHGSQLTSMKQLTSQYNTLLQMSILLFADEAFWAQNGQAESTLKGMVTEPALCYERKFGSISMGRNYVHLIVASNKEWVVPVQIGERRFAVFEVPADRRSPLWYRQMHAQLEAGGYEALMRDLMERPLGPHPREGVPQTTELADQKLLSLDPVAEWWFEILQAGRPPSGTMFDEADPLDDPEENPWEMGSIRVPAQQLCLSLEQHLRRVGAPRRAISRRLGHWLRKAVPGKGRTQITEGKARTWAYDLPPLNRCREAFDGLIGRPLDW